MKPELTAEEARALLNYDAETGMFSWRVRRSRACKRGWFPGAAKGQGYYVVSINNVNYAAHRVAWLHFHGRPPVGQVDHINGNPSDNRIANLREATQQQNSRNRSVHRNTSSGLKGVYAHSKNAAWCAAICVNGKQIYLGSFATKEEAGAAYNRAARAQFGEFAREATLDRRRSSEAAT